ncbi:ABC transporter ATP-binding protein [Microbacterium sp. Marseille-Q6965]|uniref:ABC transporter ATP-binding protein n=1 Tax=Microbacterium sp. Marseille-Q6965 TaxID=2965072 RepID=UPI0021B75A45|nr:oligopeptide/dipeptide ABC transporter ATP-binding protein [Microbacterium sp. Marseille-Q6965]
MTAPKGPILRLTQVTKEFSVRNGRGALAPRSTLRAVDGATLEIGYGETFALVGESGSGKSTLGRLAVGLLSVTAGTVEFEGEELTALSKAQLRERRRRMQVVFQDPLGSLNPRMSVGDIIAEPLRVFEGLRGKALEARVTELLEQVGLNPSRRTARPRAMSGGQRQRVGIARAIALNPSLILADEAVSALDVSVQAQITNLMVDLRERLGLSYLFIAHGLPIVRHIAQRVGVMYLGRLVEVGPTEQIFADPQHPYTRALLAASPVPDPSVTRERILLKGEPPSAMNLPSGCRFRTRCPIAQDVCAEVAPPRVTVGESEVECHFPGAPVPEAKTPTLTGAIS